MEFNKETFEKALKANKIVRYQQHFEAVVKSYLEIENQALRQPPVSGQLLLKKLENKLNTSGSYSIPYHEDSIMTYGKICDHDDGYLCEHRREWILEFFKSNFR